MCLHPSLTEGISPKPAVQQIVQKSSDVHPSKIYFETSVHYLLYCSMHSGSRQPRHSGSPLNPLQKCPHGNTLSQLLFIKSTQSACLQTSLKAGIMFGGGPRISDLQNLHLRAFSNLEASSQVCPTW
jgi:hypothetical protein